MMSKRNLAERCEALLGTSDVVHKDLVDRLVGLRPVLYLLLLHPLLKDQLKLLLLLWRECVRILDQLNQLLVCELDPCDRRLTALGSVLVLLFRRVRLVLVIAFLLGFVIFLVRLLARGGDCGEVGGGDLVEVGQTVCSLNVLLGLGLLLLLRDLVNLILDDHVRVVALGDRLIGCSSQVLHTELRIARVFLVRVLRGHTAFKRGEEVIHEDSSYRLLGLLLLGLHLSLRQPLLAFGHIRLIPGCLPALRTETLDRSCDVGGFGPRRRLLA
jgi:hypothetical protein